MKSKIFFFILALVFLSNLSCSKDDSSGGSPSEDTTSPTPGNSGAITTSNISGTSLRLNWTSASDNVTEESLLQYAICYSSTDDISTVDDFEEHGTIFQNFTTNITSINVTGLSPSTTYYFNVVVKDAAGNKAAYSIEEETTSDTADTTAPTPGNSGIIATSSVASSSLTLNWTAASDDVNASSALEYLAYYSTGNNIDTVNNCELNGTAVGSYTANITTKNVTGLSASTTYYFNVIVKDVSGNKAIYTSKQQTTGAAADTTAPTPGNSGTITSASVASTSLTLNWTAASDNVSASSALQYLAYYSTSNNINTVSNCELNGTAVGSYTANITTKNITGLSSSTTYYLNVIVKDEAGNKALYSTLTQATSAGIPSDYILRYHLDSNGNDEKSTLDLSSSTGSPTYGSSSPKEGSGYLVVDGNDDIYSPGNYNITSSSISMSGWFYINSSYSGTNPTAVDIFDIGFWYNSSGKLRGGIGGVYAEGSINTNTWYHAVVTWDNSDVKIYINGVLKETYSGSADITTINNPLYIGSNSGSDFWYGYIDDLIIYNRALSATEASNIYNSY